MFNLNNSQFDFPAVDDNVLNGDLFIPYLYYALINAITVAVGAVLVTFVEVSKYSRQHVYLEYSQQTMIIILANRCWQRSAPGEMLSEWSQSAASGSH